MARIFQGKATRQVDVSGLYTLPASPDQWYWEPDDYDGNVLWSRGYPTEKAAQAAAGEEGETQMARIFQGKATRQVDVSGLYAFPASPDQWYWEPDDYDGKVLWSRGYPTEKAAQAAAEEEGFIVTD